MNDVHAPRPTWRLRHAWRGPSDVAALALCREALQAAGITLTDAQPGEAAGAAKMHGMELVAARDAAAPALLDLSALARAADWATRLPRGLRRFMADGGRWHGIPLGIHRANAAWVNSSHGERLGGAQPADVAAWLRWLGSARTLVRAPLAIGADAMQVGLLFENVVLAMAGPQRYRRAFEALDGAVWREPAMVDALELLLALRDFADDDALALPWRAQIERVQRGDAVVAVMGDWVRAMAPTGLVEWGAPGTADRFIAIYDFFAPFASAPADIGHRAAAALTDAGFQRRFAQRKGCMPALAEAWGDVDAARARLLADEAAVLPSLTLDQCCPLPRKQALLAVVCTHFAERRSAADCAAALARSSDRG
jgi:glucose/mannose transport system substrate-binding protein